MAAPRKLRAVDADEKLPAPKLIKSIEQAAADGDQLELLVALRARVAKAVQDPNCPARDLAALTRRLQEIGKEIEAIEAKRKQEAAEDGASSTPDEEWDEEAI